MDIRHGDGTALLTKEGLALGSGVRSPALRVLLSEQCNRANSHLLTLYESVRGVTRSLAAKLSSEDQMVQSCPEASPVKWHQAHTTWFFETFVLRPFLQDYRPFREEFHSLFNSYYISLGGDIPDKKLRSSLSRPSLEDVVAFRAHVDVGIERLLRGRSKEKFSGVSFLGLAMNSSTRNWR
jgi:DinB family protein